MVSSVKALNLEGLSAEHAAQLWLDQTQIRQRDQGFRQGLERCVLWLLEHGVRDTGTLAGDLQASLSTANILLPLNLDLDTLLATLLHLGLPRLPMPEAELVDVYGEAVATMVKDLRKIREISRFSVQEKSKGRRYPEENTIRMLLGMAEDIRVVLIVIAERLHLLRSLKCDDAENQKRIASETLKIHAPLANRLGVAQLKWELEDLSLRYLEPESYRRIATLLDSTRREREGYIHEVIDTLHQAFARVNIRADITGRPKHIYSIWRKMCRKRIDFDQIFDILAVRVLVSEVADCYAALGVVHGLWRHIPGEFDDYIATPKANMYQSLHTAMIGPEDKPLEIQIRTLDMHRHAELGVAAHWAYKESSHHDSDFQRRITWMRHWLEMKREHPEQEHFYQHLEDDLHSDRIYVLTPKGKVVELIEGATPLDFAYAIHSEIGHRCRGALVDCRIVSLNEPLKSGQRVEIITAKSGSPSRDWLSPHGGYLKTNRARSRVRQWFKQQDHELHVAQGRTLLDHELSRLGLPHKWDLHPIAGRFNQSRGEDLLAALGRGEVKASHVAKLHPDCPPHAESPAEALPQTTTVARRAQGGFVIGDATDLLARPAKCCKPVPYDPIIGFITKGQGISVHRADCINIQHLGRDQFNRIIHVSWGDQRHLGDYEVTLEIVASDRKGLLRDVSSIIANANIHINGVNTTSSRGRDTATLTFILEVKSIEEVHRLEQNLRQLPDVISARRR